MTYLLDTNACIGWLRGSQPNLIARIQQETSTEIVICSIVVGELCFGVERSSPAHQTNTRLRVGQLRRQFVSLPFDDAAAEAYGRIRAALASQGTPIGPNDLLIAAIALVKRLVLVTHNTAEFSRIPGLMTEDWQ
ncbi:MAG: type II toxin-antitoxin system VapC family toxin [Planctomycetaceae bacterium]|nr:type II toxin-antitoxin system VapC family toxin [Planctomycetaceae bacterium]